MWNCRGLGVPLTVLALRDMIRLLNPELVFLSETRSNSDYVDTLKMRCNHYGIAVNSVGQSGGLALLWTKDVEVGLLSYSQNHIDVEVRSPGDSMKWYFTGFSEQNLRYRSWELLRLLETRSSPPWLVGGVTSIKSCRRERSRVVVCKLRALWTDSETLWRIVTC